MGQSWVETEIAGCDLGDQRLNRRLGAMLEALGERPGKSLPTAFQDWSNTKAAYRFFSNGNVSEDKILRGHFAASALRIRATGGPVLILQDTTEFNFKRAAPEKIGFTHVSTGHKLKDGPVAVLFRSGAHVRCLIPRFDGAILSQEWKEALWDKFVTGAPRPRTPSEQQYSDRKLRSRS